MYTAANIRIIHRNPSGFRNKSVKAEASAASKERRRSGAEPSRLLASEPRPKAEGGRGHGAKRDGRGGARGSATEGTRRSHATAGGRGTRPR